MPPIVEPVQTEVMAAQAAPWAAVAAAPGPEIIALPLDPSLDDDYDEELKGKHRSYWLLGGAALAALLIVLAIFMFTRGDGKDPNADAVTITDITGFTKAEATQALSEMGLTGTFVDEASDGSADWPRNAYRSSYRPNRGCRCQRSPSTSPVAQAKWRCQT